MFKAATNRATFKFEIVVIYLLVASFLAEGERDVGASPLVCFAQAKASSIILSHNLGDPRRKCRVVGFIMYRL